jgi:hypothetical protein
MLPQAKKTFAQDRKVEGRRKHQASSTKQSRKLAMSMQTAQVRPARFPILTLLHPREHTPFVLATVAFGLLLGWLAIGRLGWPLWGATALLLALLLAPGVAKWRADARRYGLTAMGVSILLAAQGFHSAEHVSQWLQYHVLNWSARLDRAALARER